MASPFSPNAPLSSGGEPASISSTPPATPTLAVRWSGSKFVTQKALARGLRPIVVVNKADKMEARCDEVEGEVFDLFALLDATEEQLDFPCVYASAKQGWAVKDLSEPKENLDALFEIITSYVRAPQADNGGPFRMLATTLESDPFLGRILTGRIESGTLKINTNIRALSRDGKKIEDARLTKLLAFRGLKRVPVEEAHAGDIVALAGFTKATVADTLCDSAVVTPLPRP